MTAWMRRVAPSLLVVLLLCTPVSGALSLHSDLLEPIPTTVRETWQQDLSSILESKEFSANINWGDIARLWFLQGIFWLLEKIPGLNLSPSDQTLSRIELAIHLLAVAILAIFLFAFYRWLKKQQRPPDVFPVAPIPKPEKDPVLVLRKRLEGAVASKLWVEAMRIRYLLFVEGLAKKGSVAVDRSKTFGDYQHDLIQSRPQVRGEVTAMTGLMNRVLYGFTNASEEDFRLLNQKASLVERSP